jgi:hypothetical protein
VVVPQGWALVGAAAAPVVVSDEGEEVVAVVRAVVVEDAL